MQCIKKILNETTDVMGLQLQMSFNKQLNVVGEGKGKFRLYDKTIPSLLEEVCKEMEC